LSFHFHEGKTQPRLNVKGAELLGWLLAREMMTHQNSIKGVSMPFQGKLEPLEPLYQFQNLVAGEGIPGFREGDFASALFNSPSGLALSEDGSDLFVADPGNHRVRVVHLRQTNKVETLAGNGKSGNQDNPLTRATFGKPTLLVTVPKGLLVYDAKSSNLREINLKSGSTFTLSLKEKGKPVEDHRLAGVFSMVYDASKDTLYLSEPAQGRLDMITLNDLELTNILEKNSRCPQPAALSLFHDMLCISDLTHGEIDTMKKIGSRVERTTSLTKLWKGAQVWALTASGDKLYALGGEPVSLFRVIPAQDVLAISIWDTFFSPVPFNFQEFLGGGKDESDWGLVAGQSPEKRLFLSSPILNQVFNVVDYDFQACNPNEHRLPDPLPDYNYPAPKPVHTFRILITGGSWVYVNDFGNTTMEKLAKRLQTFLNAEAALEGNKTHFEVMNLAFLNRPETPGFLWSYYLVPDVVKKYDIDLVLMGTNPVHDKNFRAYVDRPLTSEGIQFKPLLGRIPPGREGDFFRRHLHKTGNHYDLRGVDMPEVLANGKDNSDLVSLYSKPIRRLGKKLFSIHTSQGRPVVLGMFFFPSGNYGNQTEVEPFRELYMKIAGKAGIPYLDLTPPFISLRQSFFPVAEFPQIFHFTTGGFMFSAYLLTHALIQSKMVPCASNFN
jgi:hypothetical protein